MDLKNLGYTKPLYILPFDHRATFAEKMFNLGSSEELTSEQKEKIKEFKMLIYKGFKDALEKGIPKESAAILCEEEYGEEVLLDALHNGNITILTVEKSGEIEFKFQYDNFKEHIEKFKPSFTKVLIKYNPDDESSLKERQKQNLKLISDYSHENSYLFLLEVLVLPSDDQLFQVNGSREDYDSKIRPALTKRMIEELHGFGIEPDVWKLEGFDDKESYTDIINEARVGGRKNVSLVVLGRGANEEKVDQWLEVGSKVDGIIGFAVGRTVFWDALEKFNNNQIGKAEVIQTVSDNFFKFYKVFISSKQ